MFIYTVIKCLVILFVFFKQKPPYEVRISDWSSDVCSSDLRTVAHQVATGCRFHCTFCGVAAMFGGATHLSSAARLEHDLAYFKHALGADSVQYFDNNFFDREKDMVPLLEVMARFEMPWWCFARADALLKLSDRSWEMVRRSRLRMAYIGAESPNGQMLKDIRKGTRPAHMVAPGRAWSRERVWHDV